MSEPVNAVSERSEVERCAASERCERMNVVSNRVARSKRDCLSAGYPIILTIVGLLVRMLTIVGFLDSKTKGK